MKSGFFFTTNEIRPLGWIKDQLRLQADGLCGHLDLVWPDIRDSHYVGGNAEDWERVPYWLDGFIPLAYLLEDEVLIQRAKKYIDGMLSYQREDGWICPCDLDHLEEYDTWAVLLISKVLTVYYQCSKDDRIPSCLYRMMKNYYQLLSSGSIVLHDWGKYRWFEGYFAILFLETLFHEPWIMELAAILHKQGKDYHEEVEKWKKPCYEWTLDTHIVNLAMMLKSEALYCAVFHEPYTDQAEYFYHLLDTYNGTPVCTFTGDECLSGLHPNHGTELCSVVELMFSYETLYALTGDKKWAERLEICAFNALPATISDDMWSHQYDQMSNQISCEKFPGKSIFCTNGPEAHLFGLEPQFGCCTANFGQGFPKLALSAFLQCENEIHAAILLPCELHCSKGTIHLETDYPFKNEADFTIQAREDFRFSIRIPSFAQNVCLSGSSQMPELDCKKGNTYSIHLSFDTKSILSERPHHLVCVKKGSLVYSIPVQYDKIIHEYERYGVERKFPYCDYEYVGKSKWNYGLSSNVFLEKYHSVTSIPFSSEKPPVTLTAFMKEVHWETEEGFPTVCATSPKYDGYAGDEEAITLFPYGCAKLRVTEFPYVKKGEKHLGTV